MIRHICLTLLSTSLIALPAQANGWKAGVAKTIITPAPNGWMSGYAARKGPATGKAHDLWAKAFALQDVNGKKSVIVTLDVCGITRDVELPVVAEIEKKTGIPRAGIALSVSHTHCGPVVGDNLISMYPLTATELAKTKAYTDVLKTKLASVAIEAVAGLQPAQISWGMGKCNFAVNRRENPADQVPALRQKLSLKGPVDHDVPVLVAKGADGNPLGILTQYACHCTTLDYDKYSGDYAGYTQIELEKEFPGAVALFAAGCGADANPLPRRNEEMAIQYGKELATATVNVVRHGLQPLSGDRLGVAFEEIPLKLSKIPTKAELEKELADKNIYIAARAKVLLKKMADDGSLSPTYPYPVQVWKLGTDLDWFLLGGEVVVDYSLRLKRSNGANRTWVTAYTNDVCAYIPSLRVLKEGGYEGATSMIYYALPSPWAESIEEEIIASIAKLLKSLNP